MKVSTGSMEAGQSRAAGRVSVLIPPGDTKPSHDPAGDPELEVIPWPPSGCKHQPASRGKLRHAASLPLLGRAMGRAGLLQPSVVLLL